MDQPRPQRKAVADWVIAQAASRPGADYELIDLLDYPLPHFDEPISPSAVLSELPIAHVQQQLSFSMLTDFENYSIFKPAEAHSAFAGIMFDLLETGTAALKPVS
jgi:hypothetical protein